MGSLTARAFAGLLQLVVVLAALLFGPAWTIRYWQAWVFLSVFTVAVTAITLDLAKHDPALLERRVKAGPAAERERAQKVIQAIASLAFVALFLVCSLDHRMGWSTVPVSVVGVGDALVAGGLWIVSRVFRANSFTSATIEVGAEQKVISSGPYAVVRHPMYSGALVMLAGVPLALGSFWGLIAVVPMVTVIVSRLRREEAFLATQLAGYPEYLRRVRARLIPFVW